MATNSTFGAFAFSRPLSLISSCLGEGPRVSGLTIPEAFIYASGDSFVAGDGGVAPLRLTPWPSSWGGIAINGRSGETSSQILTNVLANGDASAVQVIHWGRNDSSDTDASGIIANIHDWVDDLPHDRYLILPLFQPDGTPLAHITAFNGRLVSEFGAHNTIAPDALDADTLVATFNSGDDIHPTQQGHQVLADAIWSKLKNNAWVYFPDAADSNGLPLNSLSFNGTDEYLQGPSTADNPIWNLPPDNSIAPIRGWCFSAWIRTGSSSGALFRIGLDGPYQAFGYIASNGQLNCIVGGANVGTSGVPVTDLSWHHVVFNQFWNGSELDMDIWQDGVKTFSGIAGGNQQHTSAGFTIGARFNTSGTIGSYFDGLMYLPMMLRRGLTDSEIAESYNSGTPLPTGDLSFQLDIVSSYEDSIDGSALVDHGQAKVDLTPVNMDATNISSTIP